MGSAGLAAWVAHIVFWVLLAYGWYGEAFSPRAVRVFLFLWVAGRFALSYVEIGAALFPSWVAVLDIALVFIIFKGDVRLR